MRNANGYGSIYKLSGKRRKPWVVRITTGWEIVDNREVQIRKILGTFTTKKEAQNFLFKYHDSNFNVNYLNYTFEDVYNKMLDSKKDMSKTTINSYRMAFNILGDLHSRKFNELKLNDYQQIINNCNKEYHTLRKVKSCLSVMYDFSIKNEIYNGNNLSDWLDIGKSTTEEKEIFSDEEIQILFNNDDKDICKITLILIHSSLRISELLNLKNEDVHLEERYLDIKDSKTDSGIRKVPIANKIIEYIKYFKYSNNEYLITNNKNKQFKYSNFKREFFDRMIEELNFNKKLSIHSTRHTTISLLVRNKVPSTFIKLIVGHSSKELFEKTYTHIDINELIQYIDMI